MYARAVAFWESPVQSTAWSAEYKLKETTENALFLFAKFSKCYKLVIILKEDVLVKYKNIFYNLATTATNRKRQKKLMIAWIITALLDLLLWWWSCNDVGLHSQEFPKLKFLIVANKIVKKCIQGGVLHPEIGVWCIHGWKNCWCILLVLLFSSIQSQKRGQPDKKDVYKVYWKSPQLWKCSTPLIYLILRSVRLEISVSVAMHVDKLLCIIKLIKF